MLIDFTVANYRSIKAPVTLSAVAVKRKARRASESRRNYVKPDDEIAPPYEVEGRGFALLPVLGIFGPNASGKSNVLRALDTLLNTIGSSFHWTFPWSHLTPFRLDSASAEEPTDFRLRVALEGTIYSYELKMNRDLIFFESLSYMPPSPSRERLLFHRAWDIESGVHIWKNGPDFVGEHTRLEKNYRENRTFLDLLLWHLTIDEILPLARWIAAYTSGPILRWEEGEIGATIREFYGVPERLRLLEDILCRFDIGLSGIEIIKAQEASQDDRDYKVIARHVVDGTLQYWPFEEESAGTQQLLLLAGRLIKVLENGGLMVKDELEASLHPHITRAIIRMYQNPETNPKRAQLIFASHDYTLQSDQLLRRDQIWYTRKRPDHSTELYSLSEFKERNDRDIAKSYFEGRYGAVPILPPIEDLLSSEAEKTR